MLLKRIKALIINILKIIKLFDLIYFFLISVRRFLSKRKRINFTNPYQVIGKKNYDFFLGYYDINNLSFDEKKIIFHQKPKNKNYVYISLYDLDNQSIINFDITEVWSWQLGSRVQWISDDEFIFNTLNAERKLISKSINYKNKKKKFILSPFFQKPQIINML